GRAVDDRGAQDHPVRGVLPHPLPATAVAPAMSFNEVLDEFRTVTSGPADDVPMARAALIAARSEYPDLDVDSYERRLQDIAETLDQQLSKSNVRDHPRRTIMTVNQLLYRELG